MAFNIRHIFWRYTLSKMFKEKHMSITENRASSLKTAQRTNRIPKGVDVERFAIEGIPSAWITPADAVKDKVILHLHGGGYVLGGIDSSLMMCILMAQTLKMKVLLPEYRLAPENPFPAAVDDAVKIYRWLLAQGYASKNIIVSGDSAGGGLSLATVLSLRDVGDALPSAVVCMSPWVDLTFKGKSYITKEKAEVVLRKDVLQEWAACYIGTEKSDNPLISPVYADFHGFPPLLIQVGSDEILLDDSLILAEKAKADGVDVTLKIWNDLWHVWQALGEMIPESKKAFDEMGQFVREHDSAK
jgi:acetyl esterase/lipase